MSEARFALSPVYVTAGFSATLALRIAFATARLASNCSRGGKGPVST